MGSINCDTDRRLRQTIVFLIDGDPELESNDARLGEPEPVIRVSMWVEQGLGQGELRAN